MTDRPIIFSAPMVRAILAGRKSQTRRIIKPSRRASAGGFVHLRRDALNDPLSLWWWNGVHDRVGCSDRVRFAPGDTLWVREAIGRRPVTLNGAQEAFYVADDAAVLKERWFNLEWRCGRIPSIHMPRRASRITLRVTAVRVERLQDITEEDAMAEGCSRFGWQYENGDGPDDAREAFSGLWCDIHGPGAWDRNDWVSALTFECIDAASPYARKEENSDE